MVPGLGPSGLPPAGRQRTALTGGQVLTQPRGCWRQVGRVDAPPPFLLSVRPAWGWARTCCCSLLPSKRTLAARRPEVTMTTELLPGPEPLVLHLYPGCLRRSSLNKGEASKWAADGGEPGQSGGRPLLPPPTQGQEGKDAPSVPESMPHAS